MKKFPVLSYKYATEQTKNVDFKNEYAIKSLEKTNLYVLFHYYKNGNSQYKAISTLKKIKKKIIKKKSSFIFKEFLILTFLHFKDINGAMNYLKIFELTDSNAMSLENLIQCHKVKNDIYKILSKGDESRNINLNAKNINLNTKNINLNTKNINLNAKNINLNAKNINNVNSIKNIGKNVLNGDEVLKIKEDEFTNLLIEGLNQRFNINYFKLIDKNLFNFMKLENIFTDNYLKNLTFSELEFLYKIFTFDNKNKINDKNKKMFLKRMFEINSKFLSINYLIEYIKLFGIKKTELKYILKFNYNKFLIALAISTGVLNNTHSEIVRGYFNKNRIFTIGKSEGKRMNKYNNV